LLDADRSNGRSQPTKRRTLEAATFLTFSSSNLVTLAKLSLSEAKSPQPTELLIRHNHTMDNNDPEQLGS
ncbi:7147_t:CDS:1, partial [Ambispora gerdemannii]